MTENKVNITDNLETLKEGEIVTDEKTGKKYRVKKNIMPHYSAGGPHGLGDPEDRTLRKIEADVIIPNRMNTQIERVDCNESYLGLITCFRTDGAVSGLNTCKPALELFNRCKYEKSGYFNVSQNNKNILRFHDPAFRAKMTDEYIAERSAARATGMTSQQRKIEEFRDWKKTNEQK